MFGWRENWFFWGVEGKLRAELKKMGKGEKESLRREDHKEVIYFSLFICPHCLI